MGKAGTFSSALSEEKGVRAATWFWCFALLAALAFYRPLSLWASNYERFLSPIGILVVGLVTWVAALATVLALARWVDPRVSSLTIGMLVTCLFSWHSWNDPVPGLWVASTLATGLVTYRLRTSGWLEGLIVVLAVAFGLGSVAQLAMAAVHAGGFEDTPATNALSVGDRRETAEDVIVVVFDGLPSPRVSSALYGHNAEAVHSSLRTSGFVVPDQTWSTVTATAGSIPSLLSLGTLDLTRSIPDPRVLQQMMGGKNPVAEALQSAGFRYTHIEPGWFGSLCGESVDVCVSPTTWNLLLWDLVAPSAAGGLLRKAHGSSFAHSGLEVVRSLQDVAAEIVGDGIPDFVFAHVLLPHPPFVVNEECDIRPERAQDFQTFGYQPSTDSETAWRRGVRDQLACTDRLIQDVVGAADDTTAVVITADHGTDSAAQMARNPITWSDSDIAERLSVFTAYRFPDDCQGPVPDVNAVVMRRLIECVFDVELGLPPPVFQILVHSLSGESAYPVLQISEDRMKAVRSIVSTDPPDSLIFQDRKGPGDRSVTQGQ